MTKTLKEIQAENRRLVLEARFNNDHYWKEKDKEDLINHMMRIEEPSNLSRVLLALREKGHLVDVGLSQYNSKSKFFFSETAGMKITIYGDRFTEFTWHLERETLEEQSEETQRTINQLLTK